MIHPSVELLGIEVADHDQRRVIGTVVGRVELLDIGERGSIEILDAPDRRTPIGMRGKRVLLDVVVEETVRRREDRRAKFFFHDLALGVEIRFVDIE